MDMENFAIISITLMKDELDNLYTTALMHRFTLTSINTEKSEATLFI